MAADTTFFHTFSPEYSDFWRTLARGKHQTATCRRIAKGRREVWLHATYLPVLDEGGHVVSIVKSASNVTKEKLRTAEFEGQTSALRKALAVVEASRAKSLFLATMSHEIRTPMNGMIAASDLLNNTPLSQQRTACGASVPRTDCLRG